MCFLTQLDRIYAKNAPNPSNKRNDRPGIAILQHVQVVITDSAAARFNQAGQCPSLMDDWEQVWA